MYQMAETTLYILTLDRYENEADTFAMDLLVDDDTLTEYQQYSIEQLSHILGYEKRLIELRLKQPMAF